MKTFTGLLTLALLAITGAQAQFSDLPQCGSSCAQLSTSKATACTSSDVKCLCSSEDYVNAIYDCLAGACSFGDQSSTIGRMNEICAAAASTPDASSTPPATPPPSASTTSSSAAGAASSSAAAPAPTSSAPAVVFTRTAGALTETSSSGTGTGTTTSGVAGLGTTTVPPGATTTPSQSTTVVVRTVGGEETGSAGGGNILDGNGAVSNGVGKLLLGGVVAIVGAWVSL